MVHALQEIHRVLEPDGILIDLRPLAGNWPIQVVSRDKIQSVGAVSDLQQGLEDDAAANRNMAVGAERGWFRRERDDFFPLHYYWDSPNEMQEYVEENWDDFIEVKAEILGRLRSLWAVAEADAVVRVQARMLITRWRKLVSAGGR